MPASPPANRDTALDRLDALVGEWQIQISHELAQFAGRASFEWMPGRMFLVQRWDTDQPFPGGGAIIGPADAEAGFTQHYYDQRGVSRELQMDVRGDTWTLFRERRGPGELSQRFTGTFSPDRQTVTGRWERADDGTTWQHDFDMTYRKVT